MPIPGNDVVALEHFQEKLDLAKEHQGVYARLRGLWVESGFPSENATMPKI
jgi:hypothetical protein